VNVAGSTGRSNVTRKPSAWRVPSAAGVALIVRNPVPPPGRATGVERPWTGPIVLSTTRGPAAMTARATRMSSRWMLALLPPPARGPPFSLLDQAG
jgi:hypothetical protein